MKPKSLTTKSDFAHLYTSSRIIRKPSRYLSLRVGAILIVAGLLVGSFHWNSAASTSKRTALSQNPAAAASTLRRSLERRNWKKKATPGLKELFIKNADYAVPSLVPQSSSVTVTTYASDCTTPKTLFNLQDTDKTVCAKVTGAQPSWQIIWSNANFLAVQNAPVGSGTSTFTLSTNSSLGDWRVILFEPFGGSVQQVASFTVIDAQNPSADLSISTGPVSDSVSAGGQAIFSLQVSNRGPSDATTVQLTDDVPANTTFVSFAQLTGPVFNCTSPTGGSNNGSTVCTIADLARGDSATFIATYNVGNASVGTTISNTASVSSATSDPNTINNTSTGEVGVAAAACQLTPPENIIVDADSGQAGAVVTYSTPSSSGDCGQTSTGENGEIIEPISCNPASGSFFPVGTNTVICAAQTGSTVSFQVTVNNPGALSISLSGANPLSLECGADFNDPGASAVNGTGQTVPVDVTLPQGFSPEGPAVGSYTIIYTATEGPNSVSTSRTVNVSDTQAPSITVEGANPYKIQQGSCSPFVDPGVSANDDCSGSKPVSSSIAGPNGATSVNPSVPGTYTITYSATDGTRQATATRTVLVGQFPEDEVDQPATSNQPPTITLNCPTGVTECSQVTIECGTPFTDLGATASVCGNSIAVTTAGTVDIHAPGTYSITYRASANNQTTETTRIVTVEADNTAPTITVNGANPITVECHTSFTDPGATAHDACAGDFAATASGAVDPNTVGQYTVTYNATDPSGHAATAVTRIVNVVDTTAPTVTAPPNVTVNTGPGAGACSTIVAEAILGTGSATDACQGVLSVTRTGVPAGNVFPVGQTVITYSSTDAHNNTASATQTVTVIDNTPPTISCPANMTVYLPLNTTATSMVVNYTPPVGLDNCGGVTTLQTGGLASGATFPIGTTTNVFRATDAAGNYTDCSFTVTVLYDFTGFFSPVNNLPTLNAVNAGRAIPVKFSLSGNKGLNIFAPDSPYTVSLNCATNDPGVDVTETVNAGGSSLSFGGDQYNYVWSTQSSWAGTCRQLVIKLNDGSVHTANFRFR
jgi:uncharacterized repeat protein (TIGR01451 family)